MKRLSIGMVSVLLVFCTVWFYLNDAKKRHWDDTYWNTLAAFRRASEMSLSSDNVYEPRLLEFERDLDALDNLPRPIERKVKRINRLKHAVYLQLCKTRMNEYRIAFASGSSELSTAGTAVSHCEATGDEAGQVQPAF